MTTTAAGVKTENQSASVSEGWAHALLLACKLTVDLSLSSFTVGDMLRLQPGSLVQAPWRVGTDVPLRVNGTLLAMGEFEVAGGHLAIRLTDLL